MAPNRGCPGVRSRLVGGSAVAVLLACCVSACTGHLGEDNDRDALPSGDGGAGGGVRPSRDPGGAGAASPGTGAGGAADCHAEGPIPAGAVNVIDYGAVPDDEADDSDAFDAAMAAAPAGGTVYAPPGTYDFYRTVHVRDGVTLLGKRKLSLLVARGQPTQEDPHRDYVFEVDEGHTNAFRGLAFDGGAILAIGKSSLVVDWCDFTNFARAASTGFGNGLAVGHPGWQPQHTTITNNSFHDDGEGWGIGYYRGDDYTIADNEFVFVKNGIKSNNVGDTDFDGTITRNYFSDISRMFMENQGKAQHFHVTDNYVERCRLSPNYDDNTSSLGFSIIYHGAYSTDNYAQRNYIHCPERPDGTGERLAFEIGTGYEVSDNDVDGIGTFTSVFMGDSCNGCTIPAGSIFDTHIRNNRVHDAVWGVGSAYGDYASQAHFENNGPDTALTWDTSRPKPGPGKGPCP